MSRPDSALLELVVCSLEPWDEIWRRNQFFTDILLRRSPDLRVLFVEPPADPLFDLVSRRLPSPLRVRTVGYDGRLRAFRPLKVLPRRAGPIADALLRRQVRIAARRVMGFSRPILWINDVTYAPLIRETGWPSLYDVTDDWLAAPFPVRELRRLQRLDALALRNADQVTVCSDQLARDRGAQRTVRVVSNGVDVERFRRPTERPFDLPDAPVAVYVGTLHEARVNVDLVSELARSVPSLTVTLIGPDSLGHAARRALSEPNVRLLGPKPYDSVPAYLQHADVIVVPHLVTPFTESLDPIKAYECGAVDTPVVATPVAGFREHADQFHLADERHFATRVAEVLAGERHASGRGRVSTWGERVLDFEAALRAASRENRRSRCGSI